MYKNSSTARLIAPVDKQKATTIAKIVKRKTNVHICFYNLIKQFGNDLSY